MAKILVIGASGFVGGHLARALLAAGHPTRCLARDPGRVAGLAQLGGEVVRGDLADPASLERALDSQDAAYIAVHTLSPQPGAAAGRDFMDVELDGLRSIAAACRARGVRRVVYLTFLGAAPDAPSAWVRGRWQAEQILLRSGLDATIIRPGMIVGRGGHGFAMMAGQARRRVALVLGAGRQRWRTIAVADLVHYLVAVLDDPRAVGQCLDVGSDDVLPRDVMIDVVADVLGRPRPVKLHVPASILGALAPPIERLGHFPRGSIRALADCLDLDGVGDPTPIRTIVPRQLMPYRQAVELALTEEVSPCASS